MQLTAFFCCSCVFLSHYLSHTLKHSLSFSTLSHTFFPSSNPSLADYNIPLASVFLITLTVPTVIAQPKRIEWVDEGVVEADVHSADITLLHVGNLRRHVLLTDQRPRTLLDAPERKRETTLRKRGRETREQLLCGAAQHPSRCNNVLSKSTFFLVAVTDGEECR